MVIDSTGRRPVGIAAVPTDFAGPESLSQAANENPATVLVALLQEMVRQPQFADCPFEPERMAAWLQDCVKGPALDLSHATEQQARFVGAMPPQMWMALQAASGAITSVTLSAELSTGGALLVEGLKQLDTLRSLFISVPAAGNVEIDFGRLQGPALHGRSISHWTLYVEQLGDPRSALNIVVPSLARVELTNEAARTAQPRLLKPLVQYVDGDCVITGQTHPLHGLVYDRTATDFMSANHGDLGPQLAQYRARQVLLPDPRAQMSPGHPTGENGTRVEPWDVAHLWLQRRQAHQRHKEAHPGSHERFSYNGIAASVKRHVYQNGAADFESVLAQGPRRLFAHDTFGAAVTSELREMFAGDSRYFVVRTGRGMLAIELLVKENSSRTRPSYVVNLHDPRHPAVHQRQQVEDLSQLEQMGLENWLTRALVADHFKDAPIGRLYPWPPPLERPPFQEPVSIHLPAHLAGSGALLYTALDDGNVAQVRQGIAQLVGTQKTGDSLERELLSAGPDGRVGLHETIRSRANTHYGAVKAYVEEVLEADALGVDAKLRLLRVRHRDQTWLDRAVSLGRADAVRAFAVGVLASQVGVSNKAKLLALDADASGWPLLTQYWTAAPESPLGPGRLAQLEAISTYLLTILRSRLLPAPYKEKLCAAAYGGGTPFLVTRRAMGTGNPGLVGALMLGILDAEVQVSVKDALLKGLGVSPAELVAALAALPHPGDRGWADDMIARIKEHVGPANAAATAVRRGV